MDWEMIVWRVVLFLLGLAGTVMAGALVVDGQFLWLPLRTTLILCFMAAALQAFICSLSK